MRGLKCSTLFFRGGKGVGRGGGGAGDKGQSLLKFVCLFQVNFNFFIENVFFSG